ncbi:TQO small subunit DoxD [Streptacidiphilus fuscans]|uniref:DoxX family membrane protein n=1 Tax=Streptacidiphilus fuscans TaxID=2789292 RepID=A0A931FD66_9ACTN|nr:TQO small subunit DoxD [Streptacidiphilus fuscans]MBF9067850.1 DoxX family membrane protein [Streptacidiphilus fuscans]
MGGALSRERTKQWGTTYALLPLRVFLGVTFIYAACYKFTDPNYLGGLANPQSFASMTQALRSSSPIGPLLSLALHAPTAFALAFAVGELAVGVGTLLGLLGRLAAVGGALLNLTLFLTVSWQTTPYFLGNDLIYLMAWLPLILAGTPYLSLDAVLWPRLAARRAEEPRGARA